MAGAVALSVATGKPCLPGVGVGRSCPVKYNGWGFVDVTSAMSKRYVLFVHDPKRKGRGTTVLWFASNRSQQFLWYYVVPKAKWPSFGQARVAVKKFLAPPDEPPARLPTFFMSAAGLSINLS